jgi:hypothetical protein
MVIEACKVALLVWWAGFGSLPGVFMVHYPQCFAKWMSGSSCLAESKAMTLTLKASAIGLSLALGGCGVSVGLGDDGYSRGGGSNADIREANIGDVAAVATDTLLALGGPVRSLIDANLPPAVQRPRQGLMPNLLDLGEQFMSVRAPVTGSTPAGQQVMSGILACSSGSGTVRAEFLNAALIGVGDTLSISTQDCVMNGQRYNGAVSWRALTAGTGMPGVSSAWSARWSIALSGWSQYDFIAPPIGLRAQGAIEFKAQRFAAGDAEVQLTTLQTGGQVYGLNLTLLEGSKLVSERDLSGVSGWRELAGSTYTSLDLALTESFQASQGLGSIKVRTSGETVSTAGGLPTGLWYALAPDNSVGYVNGKTPTELLVQHANVFGGSIIGSFLTSWPELRRYL